MPKFSLRKPLLYALHSSINEQRVRKKKSNKLLSFTDTENNQFYTIQFTLIHHFAHM